MKVKNSFKARWVVWFSVLVVLVLGIWPAHLILASGLLSGPVTGEVHLQGRQDYSGVVINFQNQSDGVDAESMVVPSPQQVVTTDNGVFESIGQGKVVVTARKPGYLDAQTTVDLAGVESFELGPATLYGGEVTGDNLIDISDIAYLGSRFTTGDERGDINGDGIVDILDLSMAAANFLKRGPTPWEE